MKHIRQKNSIENPPYTVVITDNWNKPLEEHPSVVEQPNVFEIADCEIPLIHQYCVYDN